MNEQQARSHSLFPAFWLWADENGCQSEHFSDWQLWWECFYAGAVAFFNKREGFSGVTNMEDTLDM